MSETQTVHSDLLIQDFRRKINQRLQEVGRSYGAPHSLYRPIEYVLEAGGKRIRPILTMLVNEAYGGAAQSALDAAVSLEMLHNFTLVHDDIMDNDYQRRGKPTVHKKWDVNTAILAGDNLLALAYKVLINIRSERLTEILKIYTDGLIDICEGQAYDKDFESRNNVTIDEYLVMIRKKTGRLISLCCRIGGVIAGAPQEDLDRLEQYGLFLGEAFQVQDDLLELTSTMDVMGKSLGSDFFEQKKTFVLLKALELADSSTIEEILSILRRHQKEEHDFQQLKKLMEITGAIKVTTNYVQSKIEKAHEFLAELNGDISHLEYLTNQLLIRES